MEGYSDQQIPLQFRCSELSEPPRHTHGKIPASDPLDGNAVDISCGRHRRFCSTGREKSEHEDKFRLEGAFDFKADPNGPVSCETDGRNSAAEEYLYTTAHEASVPHVPQVAQSVPSLEGRTRIRELVAVFEKGGGTCPISTTTESDPSVGSSKRKAAPRKPVMSESHSGGLVHSIVQNCSPISVTRLKHYFEKSPPYTSEANGSKRSDVPVVEKQSTAMLLQQFESIDIASRYGKTYRRQSEVYRGPEESTTYSPVAHDFKSKSYTCPVLDHGEQGDMASMANSPSGRNVSVIGNIRGDSVEEPSQNSQHVGLFDFGAKDVPAFSRGTCFGTNTNPYASDHITGTNNTECEGSETLQKKRTGYDVVADSAKSLSKLDRDGQGKGLSAVGVRETCNGSFHQNVALSRDGAEVSHGCDAPLYLLGSPSTRIERLASLVAVNVQNYGKPLPRHLLTRTNTTDA